MAVTVCLFANSMYYEKGGGHLWVYLNWALGLKQLGCEIIWLEDANPCSSASEIQAWVNSLRSRLEPYGLANSLALCTFSGKSLPQGALNGCLDLELAAESDLLLNLRVHATPRIVSRFRRSAFVNIDPGLLEVTIADGSVRLAPHDVYFTIGEAIGQPWARFPDLGLEWHYTPPCVALDWWPIRSASADAPFTTVAHWFASGPDENGEYGSEKRHGFLPYLDLPGFIDRPLQLALDLPQDPDDWEMWQELTLLNERGWRVTDAHRVAQTSQEYQQYIQQSFGEFSCAKPSYVRLQPSWLSDRTVCYLASGKPAIVQNTGPSKYLPDAGGLFRFQDFDGAVTALQTVLTDYDRQCRLARQLAEEYFDADKVLKRVLEQALG